MNAVIILFLLGIVLLAGEVFMPGAVLGILGGLAMAAGCVISFIRFGNGGGLAVTLLALALLSLTLYVELIWLPRSRLGKKFIIHSAVNATSQPPLSDTQTVVGKSAQAVTPLVPSGYVLVEGKRYEAFSRSGHIAKGDQLLVAGIDNFRLIVTKP